MAPKSQGATRLRVRQSRVNHAPTFEIRNKLTRLKQIIRSYSRVLVAFSGGCDSALVLKVSRDVLGKKNVLAVIARSPSLPDSELEQAREIAREVDARLEVIETHELENPHYASNPVQRCYFCKSELYSALVPLARKLDFRFILNGTNQDDLLDWRPGLRAAEEYGVKSPLVEAGFHKEDIRLVSRKLGLSSWSKPQAACLSSRIPFGVAITPERLKQVEGGEELLKELGFKIVRVRWLSESAILEVGADETQVFFRNPEVREKVLDGLKHLGFRAVDLNLQGYQSGRFNPR
jgi:uncharacterized protein